MQWGFGNLGYSFNYFEPVGAIRFWSSVCILVKDTLTHVINLHRLSRCTTDQTQIGRSPSSPSQLEPLTDNLCASKRGRLQRRMFYCQARKKLPRTYIYPVLFHEIPKGVDCQTACDCYYHITVCFL